MACCRLNKFKRIYTEFCQHIPLTHFSMVHRSTGFTLYILEHEFGAKNVRFEFRL